MSVRSLRIGLIGATGNVGRQIIPLLLAHPAITPANLVLFASPASAGQRLTHPAYPHPMIVQELTHTLETYKDLSGIILATEKDVSAAVLPWTQHAKTWVVDSSSLLRLDPAVPLIIPPVNLHAVQWPHHKIYAHANCVACPLATVLASLMPHADITHVHACTYQSTSGAGKRAMDGCIQESLAFLDPASQNNCSIHHEPCPFPRPIAFNVIPEIGTLRDDGISQEEDKVMLETQKVLQSTFGLSVTCVRVPVMVGHSIAVHVHARQSWTLPVVAHALDNNPYIRWHGTNYLTPREIQGSHHVHVGRMRLVDPCVLQLWVGSDNLLRGAACDSAEIALALVDQQIKAAD